MQRFLEKCPHSSQIQTGKGKTMPIKQFLIGLLAVAASSACQPKVQLVAPDKPIEINLTVKIDQEVRVRLDRDVEDLINENPDLF